MNVSLRQNYSVSIEATLPGNGLIIYEFPSFDNQTLELLQVIDSVQERHPQSFTVNETEIDITITMRSFADRTPESWTFHKSDRAVGFRGYKLDHTWDEANKANAIRVIRVLGRYFPCSIAGSQR